MKALELAQALNSGAEFQSEYGRRSAELEFSAPAASSELRRLAELNAELRAALEKIESSEINGVQAILTARAALAKEQQ